MKKVLVAIALLASVNVASAQQVTKDHAYTLSPQDIFVVANALQARPGVLETQLLQKLQGQVNQFATEDSKPEEKKK